MSHSSASFSPVELQESETEALMAWALKVASSKATYFEIGQLLAHRLGAHPIEDGLVELGFWVPALAGQILPSERHVYLEVFTPIEAVDFSQPEQQVPFRYECVELRLQGEFVWAVVSDMQVGSRDCLGSLYWLRYRDMQDGRMRTVRDVAPYSLPYGVYAPAELYDFEILQQERGDRDYFTEAAQSPPVVPAERGDEPKLPRTAAPVNILQMHVPTASEEGTLAGLTRVYRAIARKIRSDEPLTPAEQNYIGYDAIQLLPTEPTIEFRSEDGSRDFFSFAGKENREVYGADGPVCTAKPLMVTLRKPNTQNWGYDVPILGSSTTNASLLGSLRPDEVVDFIVEMHNFPGKPIQVIYDLVYGHSDNQALELLNRQFLAGPNMYGQDLSHTLPMVRATLLELQRRKVNTGIDGIRIDGGQDFRFFNPFSGRLEYDDNYLLAMSDVVQDINGDQRLMFTIFEDGRPWPEEGWETTSTYRELIDLRPDSFQWGPLIFAHNTPALKGFWDYKWPRVQEVMLKGDRWITGCGNHDTVRRGNQIPLDAEDTNINWNLGKTLPEVLNNAYDNPATSLWVYAFSPGLPMDFLNALMHSGWGFFRNTDDLYGVKVAAEEIGFLDWQVTAEFYNKPPFFKQLKQFGFRNLDMLKQFTRTLAAAMETYEYDLDVVASDCREQSLESGGLAEKFPMLKDFFNHLEANQLKMFALAFMEDSHEFSRVSYFEKEVNDSNKAIQPEEAEKPSVASKKTPASTQKETQKKSTSAKTIAKVEANAKQTLPLTDPAVISRAKRSMPGNRAAFNLKLRKYRQANPWLAENLSGTDRFNRISEQGHTLFYGVRTRAIPGDSSPIVDYKQVAILAHMGGNPAQTALFDWLQLDPSEWNIILTSPGLHLDDAESLTGLILEDGQAVLLEKKSILA